MLSRFQSLVAGLGILLLLGCCPGPTGVQAKRRSSQIGTGDEVVSRFSQLVRTGASGRVADSKLLAERRPWRGGKFFHWARKTSIQVLNRWLVEIPHGQRALQSVTYDVVRASDR